MLITSISTGGVSSSLWSYTPVVCFSSVPNPRGTWMAQKVKPPSLTSTQVVISGSSLVPGSALGMEAT